MCSFLPAAWLHATRVRLACSVYRADSLLFPLARFVVVSLLRDRHHTSVVKKTINPADATFNFPIFLSLADRLSVVEFVVWDKDMMLRKEYLGEANIPLEDWFRDGNAFAFEDPDNKVWVDLAF